MALSKTLRNTNIPGEATVATPVMGSANTVPETPTPAVTTIDDEVLKLDGLYNSASKMEVEFEGLVRRGVATLTTEQVGAFNNVLRLALQLVPNSVALREDVYEIDATTRAAEAHQALHVTIVPTLHNTLPDQLYERHG